MTITTKKIPHWMKIFTLTVFLSVVTCGCSSIDMKKSDEHNPVLKGTWSGEIVWKSVFDSELEKNSGVEKLKFFNCDGKIHLQRTREGRRPIISSGSFKAESAKGNHILYWINSSEPGEWVETQVWNLVEIGNEKMTIQWSRLVSNPSRKSDDKERVWGQTGYGFLKKESDGCSPPTK